MTRGIPFGVEYGENEVVDLNEEVERETSSVKRQTSSDGRWVDRQKRDLRRNLVGFNHDSKLHPQNADVTHEQKPKNKPLYVEVRIHF